MKTKLFLLLLAATFLAACAFSQTREFIYAGGAASGSGLTNLPITSLNGSGGANTAATNGTAGQALLSAGNGGVYWGTASSGGGGTNSATLSLSFSDTNVAILATTPAGCVTNAPLSYKLTLTTNALFQNPTGTFYDGAKITLELIQDGTGSRLGYWDTKFAFGTDITGITLSTTASKRDFVTAIYDSTADKWYVTGFVRGY